jgi:hypothetical protein
MTNDFAPHGFHWRVNQDTGDVVLAKTDQSSDTHTGDYTNNDMAKELLTIARCEAHSVSDRLHAYQTLINLTDFVRRASS